MKPTQSIDEPARHGSNALSAFVGTFAIILAASTFAQTIPTPPAGAPLDPRPLTCDVLKDRLQYAGALNVIGRQGWSDTFYAVPQCEFWQKPGFEYVNATDGACGLGYLCQWKPGAGSSR